MNQEEIMQSLRDQLKKHVDLLLEQDTRKANIEIEVYHYLRKLLHS